MSYPDMGSPMDPEDHPAHNLPTATEHYAGDVIPFPIPMSQSDAHRTVSERAIKSEGVPPMRLGGNKGPAKILRGPGSND